MGYLKRYMTLLLFTFIVLELFFILRITLSNFIPIHSTTFERTAAIELLLTGKLNQWRHEWRNYVHISDNLKRAIIASEDSRFNEHFGVEWNAVWKAWQHNQQVQAIRNSEKENGGRSSTPSTPRKPAGVIRGGSTITQQLAKNLFLSTEQNYFRKAQELFITLALETLLPKERLLELYLNHAQWGKGIYGIQSATQFYYQRDASNLTVQQAATIAAMLPRPLYYQENFQSSYLEQRARQIMKGMSIVSVP